MPYSDEYDDSDDAHWDDEAWTDEDQPDESAEDYTSECPVCGEPIYDDADICPHCGDFIYHDTHNPWRGRNLWWVVLGLLGIISVVFMLALGP
jgi:predicted nucleic acid-binding Zn ribbon protein